MYSESEYTLSDDREADGDYGYTESQIEFHPNELTLENPDTYNSECIDVPFEVNEGDEITVVIVIYTDGGTFGQTHGYHSVVGAYKTVKEAEQVAKDVYDNRQSGYDNRNYKPWLGYLSYIDEIITPTFVVKRSAKEQPDWRKRRRR